MIINFIPLNFQYRTTQNNSISPKGVRNDSNLGVLAYDTVSFGTMKKKEFEGIDLAVVQKFKAPIEKFDLNVDLQNWAGEKAKAIAAKDFGGRQAETRTQRKELLKEWSDYIFKENNAYKKTTALLILNAITKNLEPDNDNIPPVLNKGVLADCIYEIDKNIKTDSKYQFDLNKMYQNKLRVFYLDDIKTDTGETATKWVVIPSKEHDPENFEANVEKLKALSYKTWCTKSFNAEPYLSEGDFHVYLENGKPKLGVRFVGDEVEEIQGEHNNGKISVEYIDLVKKYINENNLKLSDNADTEIAVAQKLKQEITEIKTNLKEAIENNDAKTIFNYFCIDAEDDDGYLTILEYKQPSTYYTFKDLGIDENKLLEKVKKIKGNADFNNSMATNLVNLERINGYANFSNSQITDLGKLNFIGQNAYFRNSQVQDLNNLVTIGGDADFSYAKITDLEKLESIWGTANFQNSQITNLNNLEFIGGNAIFSNALVSDLRNLETIGKDAFFRNSQVTNLGKLKFIGNSVYIRNSQLTDEDFKNVNIGGSIFK